MATDAAKPVLYQFEITSAVPSTFPANGSIVSKYRVGDDLWTLELRRVPFGGPVCASVKLLCPKGRQLHAEFAFASGTAYSPFQTVSFALDTLYADTKTMGRPVDEDVSVCIRVLDRIEAKTYAASLDTSDVAFKMANGDEIKAHKAYLSMISPVFSRMFNGESARKTNVLELTALAHRYDVKFLLEHCEWFLICCTKVPFLEKFFYAQKYELIRLQDYLTSALDAKLAGEIFQDPRSEELNALARSILRQLF